MPFLKQQIEIINGKLHEVIFADKRFAGMQLNGLATLANYKEGDTVKTAPVVMDANNEAQWVGLDDTFPAIVYHRIVGIGYNQINNAQQYGRGVNKVVQATDVLFVVYGRFARLNLTPEQFEALIVAGFPDIVESELLAPYSLDNMLITMQASNLNAQQVYAGEYGGLPVYVSAEDILFSVRYRIETVFRKNCFSICDCPTVEVGGKPPAQPAPEAAPAPK